MIEIKLIDNNTNGTKDKDKKSLKMIEYFKEMEKLRKAGKPIYIKILAGDRKGSIAKFISENEIKAECYLSNTYGEPLWRYSFGCWGHLIWDGRKNKIQFYLGAGYRESESWLKDYTGPTIYKMFDKKKRKEKVLKNPNQKDMDDNILSVGDKVLYVNIRYGSGSQLCRGTVDRFEAKTYKRHYNDEQVDIVYTIIKENTTGEESKIEHSKELILKLN